MPGLYVDRTIDIATPATRVWEVLTARAHTDVWAPEFSSGGPRFHLESNWRLGSPVLWKDEDGQVIVEGTVTALEPNRMLRFTVFDVRHPERPRAGERDGITYLLAELGNKTRLRILHGDFSMLPEGTRLHRMTEETWDRVLPKVRNLAEAGSRRGTVPRTCGQGVAATSPLPARLGEIASAIADNLELHRRALDTSDPAARSEDETYAALTRDLRDAAARLAEAAGRMAAARDLPMGRHNPKVMNEARTRDAFERLTDAEEGLVLLLEERLEQDRAMLAEMSHA